MRLEVYNQFWTEGFSDIVNTRSFMSNRMLDKLVEIFLGGSNG